MRGGAEDEAEDGRRRFYSKPRGEPIVAGWSGKVSISGKLTEMCGLSPSFIILSSRPRKYL